MALITQKFKKFLASKRDGKLRRNQTHQSHQRNNSDWNVKENPDACYECGRTGNKTASSNSRDFKENKFKSRKALLTWDDSDESDKEGSKDEDVAQLCFMANDDDPKFEGDQCLISHASDGGTLIGATIASNILFGCGRVVNEPHTEISGIMGLGHGGTSVVTQIGTKFSYCIGSVRDPYYLLNRLIIGSGANMIGKLTPLDLHNSYYYLTLESISIGHRDLPISPRVFRRTPRGDRGVVIDSGSEWTFLIREAYVPLINTVQHIIARYVARATFANQPTWLCYYGVASRDLVGFPTVRFNFNGGANFSLGIQNMFQAVTNRIFCLNVAEANGKTPKDVSIIGVIAQQSHNIGYDLSARMLSIDQTDCRTI
ncbi:hypothetical protein RJ640_026005 [Escallonia rubra]|uniref:Peptidase A1 domain-containing protein n=1 Tax=Escallonia rubra TaxID=112253 RepID=A0AA88SB25_9ASTE|nr:hypothetical protein RJ640_026005 [Escallonia rubra]